MTYRYAQEKFFCAHRAQRKFRVEPVRNVRRRFCSQVTFSFRLPCLAVRVKPISCALRACFLGHYRMARIHQSASSCGLASWMRPHMVPDTHLLKFLFAARYINYLLWLSASLLASPRGKVASRSDDGEGTARYINYDALIYSFLPSTFCFSLKRS